MFQSREGGRLAVKGWEWMMEEPAKEGRGKMVVIAAHACPAVAAGDDDFANFNVQCSVHTE